MENTKVYKLREQGYVNRNAVGSVAEGHGIYYIDENGNPMVKTANDDIQLNAAIEPKVARIHLTQNRTTIPVTNFDAWFKVSTTMQLDANKTVGIKYPDQATGLIYGPEVGGVTTHYQLHFDVTGKLSYAADNIVQPVFLGFAIGNFISGIPTIRGGGSFMIGGGYASIDSVITLAPEEFFSILMFVPSIVNKGGPSEVIQYMTSNLIMREWK